MIKTTKRLWTRWAALFALTAILAACGAAVTPDPEPETAANPAPAAPQASCDDSAIRLLDRGAGVHGAIVSDKLHMGGATAPATCMDPANQSLQAGLSVPDGRTEQAQQSQYYLIVIRYPGGNRLYVLSRRADGSSCVVNTNDECIARVIDLPDDFDLETLPDDVAPTIPAGRPAPPTVGPSPRDDETPPAPGPAPGDETPPAPSPPPGDGAPPPATGPPGAARNPSPRNGATGVSRGAVTFSWDAAPGALSYDFYMGTTNDLPADGLEGTEWPLNTVNNSYEVGAWAPRLWETRYYWRVDVKTEAGTIRGNVWSFTTIRAPGYASNPQPRDGATGVTVAGPLLSWAAAPRATHYNVYWSTTSELLWRNRSTRTTSTFLRIPTSAELAPETRYYWMVDALNESGLEGFGKVWSFTTAPAPPPAEQPAPPTAEPPAPVPPPAEETPPTISFADLTYTFTERDDTLTEGYENGWVQVKIYLNVTSIPEHLYFKYWATPGTATPCTSPRTQHTPSGSCSGTDYTILFPINLRSGIIDFVWGYFTGNPPCSRAPGDDDPRCSQEIQFRIVGDLVKEETETFQLHIGPLSTRDLEEIGLTPTDDRPHSTNVTCGGRCTATVTILDND